MKRLFLFLLAALVFQHANAVDVDFYDRLLRVKSVSSDIAQCNEALELTKDYLEKSGVWCRVESNEEGRKALWASTHPGTTADYVIAVHLDVVPAENDMFIPRVKDGKMYARGAIDCKGQVMVALGILKKLNNKSSVGVIFATDEEVGGLTTKMMVERGTFTVLKRLIENIGLYIVKEESLRLSNFYYDTSKLDLQQNGIALRVRKTNKDYEMTIKTKTQGVSDNGGVHIHPEYNVKLYEKPLAPNLLLFPKEIFANINLPLVLSDLNENMSKTCIRHVLLLSN
jgi:hypothetical protein